MTRLLSIVSIFLASSFIYSPKAQVQIELCEPTDNIENFYINEDRYWVSAYPHWWVFIGFLNDHDVFRNVSKLRQAERNHEYVQFSFPANKTFNWPLENGSRRNCSSYDYDVDTCRIETASSYFSFTTDTDNDGLYDEFEEDRGLDPYNASDAEADLDGDGVSNIDEWHACSALDSADTDEDGMADAYEIRYSLRPYDGTDADEDPDNDGATNLEEFLRSTNPRNSDEISEINEPDKYDTFSFYSFENDTHQSDLITESGEEWTKSDQTPYRGDYSYYRDLAQNGDSTLRFVGRSNGGVFQVAHMLQLFDTEGHLRILLNGKEIFAQTETSTWQTFTYDIPKGNYILTFEVNAAAPTQSGNDFVQIDNLRLPGLSTISANYASPENQIDFENGQIGTTWDLGTENQWDLYATSAESGYVSIGSADIAHSERSRLAYSGTFKDGTIKFKVRAHSERRLDILTFYVDGEAIKAWSSNTPWLDFEMEISSGPHLLEWIYEKNHMLSSGSDKVWLDNVKLPLQ